MERTTSDVVMLRLALFEQPQIMHVSPVLSKDMRRSGCGLAEILAAGQWKSAPFLRYIDEVLTCADLLLACA